jgi:hypothetical protein
MVYVIGKQNFVHHYKWFYSKNGPHHWSCIAENEFSGSPSSYDQDSGPTHNSNIIISRVKIIILKYTFLKKGNYYSLNN